MSAAEHTLRFEAALIRAEWNWARAAACPWWSPVRRWCLIRRARACELDAERHFDLAVHTAKAAA